ncbi:MAG: S8 family peptidase, partial [Myxococcales bacterium]
MPVKAHAEAYTRHDRKFEKAKVPAPESRAAHGLALKEAFERAVVEALRRRSDTKIQVHGATPGLYVQFESQAGVELRLSSLEDKGKGIEVVAVTYRPSKDEPSKTVERATVFVPEGKVEHFIRRFETYANDAVKRKGERRHEDMLDPVATLRLATLRGLWTDSIEVFPRGGESIWWEVWLRRQDGRELERLMEFAAVQGIHVSGRRLEFDDRIVTLVRATSAQLAASVDVLNDLAEVRRAKETASEFLDMGLGEKIEWMQELRSRTQPAGADAPAVCILDTGVTRGHPLLESAIASADCHAYEAEWGTHDHNGHGTEMAGLALYGDLTPVLAGSMRLQLSHRLESVKILPPPGKDGPELYGAIMAAATSRAEIEAPQRRRCFSLAVTAVDDRDRGRPSSWSAAVDALAAGRAFDTTTQGLVYVDEAEPERRLFVVSAGNVEENRLSADHLSRSDTEPVHDPAQAWNALTVGAYTDKAYVRESGFGGLRPVAEAGDLSPWSTTGVAFADPWPMKPDVVLEGGNVLMNRSGEPQFSVDLCLLSTYFRPATKPFVASWATSAATAQASRLAGMISAQYPSLWPETIRALIVHSAEWTPPMLRNLSIASGKRARAMLVRRYGFGVPRVASALRSASDALTLIVQDSIRPFEDGRTREMHTFELPWPKEALADLGETTVRLRVTLSYFI